jgi:hypothetical protein
MTRTAASASASIPDKRSKSPCTASPPDTQTTHLLRGAGREGPHLAGGTSQTSRHRATAVERVDFGLALRLLRDAGREDINVIVEHWPPFEETIEATVLLEEEWLATSVRFLRAKLRDRAA